MRSEAPPLLPILRSRHQAELLTLILLHPDQEYTLTTISQQLGIPLTTVQREIGRLAEAELIIERRVGKARVVAVNPANRYTSSLTELLTLAFGPHLIVAEEFGTLKDVSAISIYGSWAKRYAGQAGPPPHDVDVLVIGTPDRTDVYDAADRSERRLGMPVNPTICTPKRWTEAADPLIQQIKAAPIHWVQCTNSEDQCAGPLATRP
jgi:AraC-like DNA-binding protein